MKHHSCSCSKQKAFYTSYSVVLWYLIFNVMLIEQQSNITSPNISLRPHNTSFNSLFRLHRVPHEPYWFRMFQGYKTQQLLMRRECCKIKKESNRHTHWQTVQNLKLVPRYRTYHCFGFKVAKMDSQNSQKTFRIVTYFLYCKHMEKVK